MSESFTDSTPSSDNDPYSSDSSSPPASSYNIDRTSFPKPIPIFGSYLGYNDKLFADVSRVKIEHASQKLERPLTSDEASALAYWGAKQLSIMSYGTPVGVAGGAWRCWDTRAKFRFPFYGPNMATFNPMQFPNKMVFVNGPKAPLIWHIFRGLFYAGFGKFAGSILFGSYAMSVAAVGELGDPRLKSYRDKITADAKTTRPGASASRFPQGIPPQSGKQAGKVQAGQVGSMEETKTYDDASPSGGMFFDPTPEDVSNADATSERIMEKVQPTVQRRSPLPPQQNNENENSPFGMFDDASPTGGQGVSPEAASSPASTGSAWDRIRSGQKPATPRRQSHESTHSKDIGREKQRGYAQTGNESDEGFKFSSLREDKRYNKDVAQKEFDEKIERERKGGEFSSGNGDRKRW